MNKKCVGALLAAACLLLGAVPVTAAAYDEDVYGYYEEDTHIFYDDIQDYDTYVGDTNTLKMSAGNTTIKKGETVDLNPWVIYKDFYFDYEPDEDPFTVVGGMTWESLRPDIATVNSKGVVTGLKGGTARITVTFWNNKNQKVVETIRVTVTAASTVPTYAKTYDYSFEIDEGKSIDLRELLHPGYAAEGYGTVTWASSNEEHATVDQNGLVMARDMGRAVITATHTDAGGNVTQQEVLVRANYIYQEKANQEIVITLKVGETVNLRKVYYPNYTSASTYGKVAVSSNNASVVSADGEHTITAKSAGTATVTLSLDKNGDERDVKDGQKITVKVVK